jgi:hypothetical protein
MFSFFKRRKYGADVKAHINELFAAMPKEYLSTAKQLVNLEATIHRNFEVGTPTKECAIYCAAFLMAAPIQRMDQPTRNDLLRQYENHDTGAFNVGLNVLLSTAMKYTNNLATIDALGSEIFGALRGMSREEKEQWLQQLAIDKLNGHLPPWAS